MNKKRLMMLKNIRAVALVALLVCLSGCGYRFSTADDYLGRDIRKVYLAPFENRTQEAYVENYFREAFTEEFIRGGRFQLAKGADDADIILKGKISRLLTSHVSYRSDTLAAEERVTAFMEVSLEKGDGSRIWMNGNLSGSEDYRVDDNLNLTRMNRKNALLKLADGIAERAFRAMMSGF